eukprot:760789-Hanusia_phi.AAC.11
MRSKRVDHVNESIEEENKSPYQGPNSNDARRIDLESPYAKISATHPRIASLDVLLGTFNISKSLSSIYNCIRLRRSASCCRPAWCFATNL